MSKQIDTPLTPEEELAQVKKLNAGFVDEDPVKDPPKDPVPPVDPPKDPPKDPVPPVDPPKDPPVVPEPPVVPPVVVEPPSVPRARPETYIPIPQYQSEKKEWKDKEEVLKAKITELEAIAKDTKKDSPSEDAEIKAIAEKHGYSEEAVRDFVLLARKGLEVPKEQLAIIDQKIKDDQARAEVAHFEEEFTAVAPSIKEQFPEATAEQLVEAKKLLNTISHTKKYADKDLDYVLFKEKAQFDPLFVKGEDPPKSKTIDGGKVGKGGPVKLTAKDFKENKDFQKLDDMTEDEKQSIISSLDPFTYDRYVKFESHREDNGIEVNRDGRTIKLK